ncbi:MAG: S9 family peptidase [Bacteroidota bacterium]|nr:S9 family peptidase [Bacteroidota bacterium]
MRYTKHIFALLLCGLFFQNIYAQDEPDTGKLELKLADIWETGRFSPKFVSGYRSMKDGEFFSKVDYHEGDKNYLLNQYSYKTGKLEGTIAESRKVKPAGYEGEVDFGNYQFNNNEMRVLFEAEHEQVYRHSFTAKYFIFDRKSRESKFISTGKGMNASFGPNDKYVAMVRDNDLYLINIENNMSETRITNDGKKNEIINGAADWVYEEEFALTSGYSFSPDGKYIAYYRFDESNVKSYSMPLYNGLYPSTETFKYPKAGENNSVVTIWIYEIATGNRVQVNLGTETDIYIPRIKWNHDGSELCVYKMNRLQNNLDLLMANPKSGVTRAMLSEASDTYVEVPEDLTFLENGDEFLMASERNGYKHLYLFKTKDGSLVNQITKGKWEVDQFIGYDKKSGYIYFNSTEVSFTDRNLWRVKLDGTGKKRITIRDGNNEVHFSSNYKYFLCIYSNINTPYFISIYNNNGYELRIVEDNKKLRTRLERYELSTVEFFEMNTSEMLNLYGYVFHPKKFDTNKKHPVLQYVYGGPGSQLVVDKWMGAYYYWFQYLASKGYVVVCVDGRGTGGRGASFKKVTYKEMGHYEIIDQIEVAKWLGTQPWADASRIGMFGWSFGGYMSSLAITKGAAFFKTAIAVAPVTNWRFYDNIYTERYMQKPQDNAVGYDQNSPINFVDKIKGNYLIIHGTGDDNVHFQNSAEMVNAMINKNIPFDSEYYPNKNHGIRGGKTRLHLFTRISKYIFEKL